MASASASEKDGEMVEKIEGFLKGYNTRFTTVKEITVDELKGMMDEGKENLVVVDHRDEAEQAVSMLPGAITSKQFEAQIDTYDKEKTTVACYCTIGARSGYYVKDLVSKGWPGARNVHGSVLSWAHAGYPVIDPATGEPVNKIHTWSKAYAWGPEAMEQEYYRGTSHVASVAKTVWSLLRGKLVSVVVLVLALLLVLQ